jgi:hypothetical protein
MPKLFDDWLLRIESAPRHFAQATLEGDAITQTRLPGVAPPPEALGRRAGAVN